MLIALDFETHAIDTRPKYPPEPVGLAYLVEGGEPEYMDFGHPGVNRYSFDDCHAYLLEVLSDTSMEYVFHNAPFDCAVIEERFGIVVPWHRVHDTMVMAFLHNPHGELSLKPLAERLLGLPPTEQDAVRNWLVAHGICRANDKQWGAYICKAPAELVGTYAKGDVVRTIEVYRKLESILTQEV